MTGIRSNTAAAQQGDEREESKSQYWRRRLLLLKPNGPKLKHKRLMHDWRWRN